jgi:hypothetical protein
MKAKSDGAWDAYVHAHSAGTFFHLAGWRTVVEQTFNHRTYQLEVRRDGALVGVAPLVELRSRLFGHALISNGFCVGGGPIASDDAALTQLLEQAERLGRDLGVDYIELRDAPDAAPGWLAKDNLYATFDGPLATGDRGESPTDSAQAARRRTQVARARSTGEDRNLPRGLLSAVHAHDAQPRHPRHAPPVFRAAAEGFRRRLRAPDIYEVSDPSRASSATSSATACCRTGRAAIPMRAPSAPTT